MPNQRPSKPDHRPRGYCDECDEHKPLNMVYDARGANIMRRLCDRCLAAEREKKVGGSNA